MAKPAKSSQQCDIYHVHGKKLQDINADDDILSSFVAPVGGDVFKSRYFRRRCVAILGGGLTRLAPLLEEYLHSGDIESLAEDTASEHINVWLRPRTTSPSASRASAATSSATGGCKPKAKALPKSKSADATSSAVTGASHGGSIKAVDADGARIDSIRLDSAKDAMTCYNAGGSLYFRSSQRMADAFIPAMSEALGMGAGNSLYFDSTQSEVKGEIEVFCSRAGHVTSWHFDFQENFTFQISGKKTWRLKKGGHHSPVRGATPHYKTPSDVIEQQVKLHKLADPTFQFSPPIEWFDDAFEVTLGPGDLFYFPAGCWHRVECTEDSLSINLSLIGSTWGDLTSSALRTLAWRDSDLRQIATFDNGMSHYVDRRTLQASAAGAGSSSLQSSSATEDSSAGDGVAFKQLVSTAAMFPGLQAVKMRGAHATADLVLQKLFYHVLSLRPEFLVPPCSLVSRRYDGMPGGDVPIRGTSDDGDDDEDGSGSDEDTDDGTANDDDAADDDSGIAGPGVKVRFEEGQMIVRVLLPRPTPAHSSGESRTSATASSSKSKLKAKKHKSASAVSAAVVAAADGDADEQANEEDVEGQCLISERDTGALAESMSINVDDYEDATLEFNPIAVMLRAGDIVNPDDDAAELDGTDADDGSNAAAASSSSSAAASAGRSSSRKRKRVADVDSTQRTHTYVRYIVHVNFGGEELTSFARTVLEVPSCVGFDEMVETEAIRCSQGPLPVLEDSIVCAPETMSVTSAEDWIWRALHEQESVEWSMSQMKASSQAGEGERQKKSASLPPATDKRSSKFSVSAASIEAQAAKEVAAADAEAEETRRQEQLEGLKKQYRKQHPNDAQTIRLRNALIRALAFCGACVFHARNDTDAFPF